MMMMITNKARSKEDEHDEHDNDNDEKDAEQQQQHLMGDNSIRSNTKKNTRGISSSSSSSSSSWKFLLILVCVVGFVMAGLVIETKCIQVTVSSSSTSSTSTSSKSSTTTSSPLQQPEESQQQEQQPKKTKFYYDDIVIMGQFNYNTIHVEYVVHWYKRWKEIFRHVEMRGPFTTQQINILKDKHNITTVYNDDPKFTNDAGYYSPMYNLVNSIKKHQHDRRRIRGILSIHDDLLLNLTAIDHILSSPNQNTIITQIPTFILNEPVAVFHLKDKKYRTKDDPIWHSTVDISEYKRFRNWHWDKCMESLANATYEANSNLNLQKYMVSSKTYSKTLHWVREVGTTTTTTTTTDIDEEEEEELWMPLFSHSYTDVIYIPYTVFEPTIEMGTWLSKHFVFLECSFVSLLEYLTSTRYRYNDNPNTITNTNDIVESRIIPSGDGSSSSSSSSVNTTTNNNNSINIYTLNSCVEDYTMDRTTYVTWTKKQCVGGDAIQPKQQESKLRRNRGPYDIYHPIKLSSYGTFVWDLYFNKIVLNR